MRAPDPRLGLAGLILLATVTGSGDARPQEAPPTFPSDAQVVVLDVVATDDRGRPIADLGQGDLEVSEDGARCRILSFRLVGKTEARTAGRPSSPPVAGAEGSPTLPAPPTRPSLVVLVFDRLTTETAPLAREGARDLLSRSFPPDTWFAVFKVGYGIRMLTSFTTAHPRLEAAITAATTGDAERPGGPETPPSPPTTPDPGIEAPVGPTNPFIPDLGPVAPAAAAEMGTLARAAQGLDSLYALRGIARALSVVQGRKSVVYFAEAWHLPTRTQQVYEEAVSVANRAGVAVNTVDVRGLTPHRPRGLGAADSVLDTLRADYGGGPGTGSRTPTTDAAGSLDEGGGAALKKMEDREELLGAPRLERLAEDTGGLAIQSTNDLGTGLADVARELGQYYEVVYAPASPIADGKFRRIAVKTSRKGVRLRTRAGYFATPGRSAVLHAYELPLMDALEASPAPTDLTLRAGLLSFAPEGAERRCLVLAEVPLSEVQLVDDEARGVYRAHLAFLGHVRDGAGRVIARLTHDWPLEGPLRERSRARSRSALFRQELRLLPGRYVLEAAAQDRNTGARGTSRASFEVRPVPRGLALSSVVVPRRAAPAAGGAPDPLRIGDVSLVPGLGRPIEAGSTADLLVYVGVYPANQDDPVELKVQYRRDGQVVAETSPSLPPAEPGVSVPWIGRLPLARLQPGDYEVAVVARQGAAEAQERGHFEIVAGSGTTTAPVPPPPDPELSPVLERAARYVVAYQDTFCNIVAEERYTQKVWGSDPDFTESAIPDVRLADGSRVRRTRADLVFVRLSGDIPWGVFRDVFEANGNAVRDRDERLVRLFREPSPSTVGQARRILEESARYNVGPRRTVNIPTMALLFLHPRNQSRFAFERAGSRRIEGFEGVGVRFREVQRPTLTRELQGRSVPVRGTFWIDASRGAVLRSEARYRFEPDRAEGFIAVEYRREPRLGMWVPSQMWERYRDFPGSHEPVFRQRAEATARYSNYRQFQVSVDETAASLAKPGP